MTGSGTSEDPYIISDVDDLQAIEDHLASYYELGGDIDASATSDWNGGAGFDPINLFTGQLDGKDFTISSLFINRPTENYCGLIGYADGSIVLKNIKMTGADITGKGITGALLGYAGYGKVVDIDDCSSTGVVEAANGQVGGLIGYVSEGTVDDCWSSCTVTNGSGGSQTGGLIGYNGSAVITQCYATGAVTSSDSRTGGLIGEDWDGALSKCYATGNVSGVGEVGGLVGRVNENPSIDDCYARGNAATPTDYYAGGLIGRNDSGVIDDCYSTGAATAADPGYQGGLISKNYGTVTNCFWDTETSGNATSDGGTGKTTAQMKAKATFTDAGWDFTTPIWYLAASLNDGYPGFVAGPVVYPTDAISRVTNLIHRYNRNTGVYTLEMALGEVTTDFGLPEWLTRPQPAVPEEPVPEVAVSPVTGIPLPTRWPPAPGEEPGPIACPRCGMIVPYFELVTHIRTMHPAPTEFPAYEEQLRYEKWFEEQMKKLREMGYKG